MWIRVACVSRLLAVLFLTLCNRLVGHAMHRVAFTVLLYLSFVDIEVKCISSYFSMDHTVTMMQYLQALRSTNCEVEEIYQTNGRFQDKVIPSIGLEPVLDFSSIVKSWPKIQGIKKVVLPWMLIDRHDYGGTVARLGT